MENRLITLLGAGAIGAGALTLAQTELEKAPVIAPATAEQSTQEGLDEPFTDAQKLEIDQVNLARGLVVQLADESYRVREEATKSLWNLGEVGMAVIKEGVESEDPEVAHRSKILLQRILTGITPDTPENVVRLVQKYFRSGTTGKKGVFEDLFEEEAYDQMLRIYRFEQDERARTACEELVDKAVLPAVLAALVDNRLDDAEELLRLAPIKDQNSRRLAAILRVQGRLDAELAASGENLKFDPNGDVAAQHMDAATHHLALLRSAGRATEAREFAQKMGREDLVAGLALFEGDPGPYLRWFMDRQEESPVVRIHAETVLKRWQGDDEEADRLMKSMAKVAKGGGEEKREAMLSLLLNGYLDLGIPLVVSGNKDSAFGYYETIEQPEKAVKVFGYTGTAEEKKEWLEKRLKELRAAWAESEDTRYEILTIASFLHTRGEREEAKAIMLSLSEIAERQGKTNWLEFIGRLNDLGGSLYELAFFMAADMLDEEDAEEKDAIRIVAALFGEGDSASRLWSQLESIEEKISERILLLGALYGAVHFEFEDLREVFEALEAKAEKGPVAARVEQLSDLLEAAEARDDSRVALGLLEVLIEIGDANAWRKKLASYYSYASDWEKAIGLLEGILEDEPTNLRYLAIYGGAMIRAGQADESVGPLRKVELFGLDEPIRLLRLAIDVERSGAVEEAGNYWRQLLISNPPTDWYWQSATSYFAKHARRNKQWRVAAAFSEVDALQYIKGRSTFINPVTYIRKRFIADLYRGLALLEEGDKERAMKLFRGSFEMLNGDGILADDYFPLLREAGVLEEHDRNFEIVYQRLEDSIKSYPKAHNTYNSAAWMASRASRDLDDALEKIRTALSMRPKQAAYLDTMAEVWFAKKNREKAVEWSRKAVQDSFHGGYSTSESGVGLREQFDRFRTGDFPVP